MRNTLIPALFLLWPALLGNLASAGQTWDGGGPNDNWSHGFNWNDPGMFQFPPPNNGTANIVMPAMGGLVQTPIVDVPYSINSLTFAGGDGRFVILGAQELTIGAGGVTNNDADVQSVIGPVKLSANQTWTAAAGPLQMDAVNLNGFDLTMAGAFPTDLISVVAGTGNVLLPVGYLSTTTMASIANNTYSGTTEVRGGTLVLQKTSGAVAVPGPLTIGPGAVRSAGDEQISHAAGNQVSVNSGLLDLDGHNETLARLSVASGGNVTTGAGTLGINEHLEVNGGTITGNLSLGDATAQVTSSGQIISSSDLTIGDTGNGALDIMSGGVVTNDAAYIGTQTGSMGEVTVDGVGSTWTNTGSLYVGVAGIGALNVTDGGFAHSDIAFVGGSATSTGEVLVDGSSGFLTDRFLIVGENGLLTVSNDANVQCLDMSVTDGSTSGSVYVNHGTVRVIPERIYSQFGDYYIGGSIRLLQGAVFELTNNSVVISTSGSVHAGALARVDGSIWASNHQLDLNYGGFLGVHGSLEVTNGGSVGASHSISVTVNTPTGEHGSVFVDGGGGLFAEKISIIGGDITIQGDGSTGTAGSVFEVTAPLQYVGRLTILDGGFVHADDLIVRSRGSVYGNGNIVGNVKNEGLISPGTSPGALSVDGDYTQTIDGRLLIELASSGFDQLLTTGTATLAGTLQVDLLDGFIPSIGQTYTIFTADDVDFEFTTESLPSVPGLIFDVIYNAQSVVLEVLSGPIPIPGDGNGDGWVDGLDYLLWAGNFGDNPAEDPPGFPANGDYNHDDVVNGLDYLVWAGNFGTHNTSTAVPEPGALVLALFAVVGCLSFPRRRST